jgi:hypothetical protein
MAPWVLVLVRPLPMTPAGNLRVSSRRRLASSVGSARPVHQLCPFISRERNTWVEKPVLTVTPLVLNQDTFPRPLAFLKPRDEEREVSRA